MFLQLDGTFIVQLINFAIFFAILNVVFIRPVAKAIVARREYINSVTNDYDRYQAETASLRAQAESIRSAARREAQAMLAQARAESSNESAALSASYNQTVAQTIEQANQTVQQELQAARASRPQIVAELAAMMVDRTLAGATS